MELDHMSIKKNIELDKGAENMSVEDKVIDTPSNHDEYEANRLKIFKKRALRDLHSYFGENPKECLSAEGLYYEKTKYMDNGEESYNNLHSSFKAFCYTSLNYYRDKCIPTDTGGYIIADACFVRSKDIIFEIAFCRTSGPSVRIAQEEGIYTDIIVDIEDIYKYYK